MLNVPEMESKCPAVNKSIKLVQTIYQAITQLFAFKWSLKEVKKIIDKSHRAQFNQSQAYLPVHTIMVTSYTTVSFYFF